MSAVDLPGISGHLDVLRVDDGYVLIRTDCSPTVEVAVVHDGADRGIGETEAYVALLARTPGMRRLLNEALAFEAKAFDDDEPVSGADLVQWFAEWRGRVRTQLTQPLPPPDPVPGPVA